MSSLFQQAEDDMLPAYQINTATESRRPLH